jgi:hypothetical protein
MKNILLLFAGSFSIFTLLAQEKLIPKLAHVTHKLGDNRIRINIYKYGSRRDIVFINLHANETTSVNAAQKLLEIRGGILIALENDKKRNIGFNLNRRGYTFDPNRIFSRNGIRKTLAGFMNISEMAVNEVEKFASRIISILPQDSYCIIALHNNTDGNLSVNSFLEGNEYETDARQVYANEDQDPDDFFLTTDSLLYEQLSAEKYNIIWQDNLRVQQDGSLSVYAGEKNICYLNCETEHGKSKQYEEMIRTAWQYIDQKKNSSK